MFEFPPAAPHAYLHSPSYASCSRLRFRPRPRPRLLGCPCRVRPGLVCCLGYGGPLCRKPRHQGEFCRRRHQTFRPASRSVHTLSSPRSKLLYGPLSTRWPHRALSVESFLPHNTAPHLSEALRCSSPLFGRTTSLLDPITSLGTLLSDLTHNDNLIYY